MSAELFPLRSLPWQHGVHNESNSAPASDPLKFDDPEDWEGWEDITLLLRTCGA